MTHETFVSLKTAKLLKQVGFDWECRAYHFNEKLVMVYGGETTHDTSLDLAPLQAVAQRWLREVKDIHLYVECCADNAELKIWYSVELKTREKIGEKEVYISQYLPNGELPYYTAKEFPTYEAALEAGLQKCLTLLIEKQ